MDHDNQMVREVTVSIVSELKLANGASKTVALSGEWGVGQAAYLSFPVEDAADLPGVVQVEVRARLAGARPYAYEDEIVTTVECPVFGIAAPATAAQPLHDTVAAR
jgi:hypothetical protein